MRMLYKIPALEADGSVSIFEWVVQPGTGVGAHTHAREDELTYILAGEMRFKVGSQTFAAGPGSYVVKPRRVSHAFWNTRDQAARVIEVTVPGNLDRYYDELASLSAATNANATARREAVSALSTRYGISWNSQTAEGK
jgi:mannose-6-phosphate isomerase-like protein (cupin superfamily)